MYTIAANACTIIDSVRFVSFLKYLGRQALNIWLPVMSLADYHSDAKRTAENFPKAWNKLFEMLYNCRNTRDVHIQGFEMKVFKKPLRMDSFDYVQVLLQ